MPFSDNPPIFVYPDTRQGRAERAAFVKEEFDILSQVVVLCDRYEPMRHPVFTDDDVYRNTAMTPCSNRSRAGVRDKNWCCRCAVGFPHTWLSKRDSDLLSDEHIVDRF